MNLAAEDRGKAWPEQQQGVSYAPIEIAGAAIASVDCTAHNVCRGCVRESGAERTIFAILYHFVPFFFLNICMKSLIENAVLRRFICDLDVTERPVCL